MKWLPPVATMLPLGSYFKAGKATLYEVDRLADELVATYNGSSAAICRSGRAALAITLSAIAADRGQRGVILPAYTCYSVASAIARAGLLLYPADIFPETLDFNYRDRSRPPPEDVFAVISPGLFGIPSDLKQLEQICADQKMFLIEDAAQTLGARIDERPAGCWGDASLLSFSRGKPVGALRGGCMIAHRRSISKALDEKRFSIDNAAPWNAALKGFAQALAVRPGIFGIVRLLPFVRMGVSVFQPDFPTAGLDIGSAALIRILFPHLNKLVEERKSVARNLESRVAKYPGIILPSQRKGIEAAYLRFPLIFEDSADRDAAIFRFTSKGLGASTMYPLALPRIEKARDIMRMDLGPFPGAEKVARGIVTLPTHAAVTEKYMDEMEKIIREITSAGGS
jgi:perosamine synthetase